MIFSRQACEFQFSWILGLYVYLFCSKTNVEQPTPKKTLLFLHQTFGLGQSLRAMLWLNLLMGLAAEIFGMITLVECPIIYSLLHTADLGYFKTDKILNKYFLF